MRLPEKPRLLLSANVTFVNVVALIRRERTRTTCIRWETMSESVASQLGFLFCDLFSSHNVSAGGLDHVRQVWTQ